MSDDLTLQLADIKKSYRKKLVLNDISHTFRPGLSLLVGPSGAGKSTLLRLCATAEKPDGGTISWNGVSGSGGRRALRQSLGYAPQAVELPEDLTAREFAHHIAALKQLDIPSTDRQFMQVTDAIGLIGDIDRRIGSFSGGMRRRLIFAQSLLGTPRLIALDEPTAELDRETSANVVSLILAAAQTSIVLMTTHLADELSTHAQAILVVRDGSLTATK
jgi:ABC-2 type transport system ATP-binding protein